MRYISVWLRGLLWAYKLNRATCIANSTSRIVQAVLRGPFSGAGQPWFSAEIERKHYANHSPQQRPKYSPALATGI